MSDGAGPELCHCGQPLHYLSRTVETLVRRLIVQKGELLIVRRSSDARKWLVPRHYIALHGLKERDLPGLGFREITGLRFWLSPSGDAITCGKCARESHNASDVAQRYCGYCKEFMCQ